MATEIVKPQAEIIPRPNLLGVEVAIGKLAIETEKLEPLKRKADSLLKTPAISATPEQCAQAKALQLEVRTVGKAAALNLDPYWQVVKAAQDALSQIYTVHEEKAKEIDAELKAWVKDFETEEKRKAKIEEDRKEAERIAAAEQKAKEEREERERAAKEERQAKVKEINAALKAGDIGKRQAAKMLKEAGAEEEARLQQAEAEAEESVKAAKEAPRAVVKPNIPTQAGVPSRTNYKAELLNPDAIVEAYIRTFTKPIDLERRVYLRQFITVDAQKIGEEARRVKDSKLMATKIPGVRFYED
jgi:DNA repair exonuclease SbcCD ATPase subunit